MHLSRSVISACALDSGNALLAQRAAPQGFIGGVVRSSRDPKPACGSSRKQKICPRISSRSSSPTTRAASWCRSCRPRTTACSCAGTAWSIRRRCRRSLASPTSTLTATVAKTPQEAAKVYPGDYWLSLLEPPAAKDFPGTGPAPEGNGLGKAHADAEPLHQLAEVRLQLLPSARQQAHAHRGPRASRRSPS